MGIPVMKTSHINEVPASLADSNLNKAELKTRWEKAEAKLTKAFPKVPQALWFELGQSVMSQGTYTFTPENDPYVHAYLLSQEFSLVVQKIITDEVGQLPIHAQCGCSDCLANPGLKVGILLSGAENLNYAPLEADFLKHAELEIKKFKAIGLL